MTPQRPSSYSLSTLSGHHTALLAYQLCVGTEGTGRLSSTIGDSQSDEDPKKALTNCWDLTQDKISTQRFVPESFAPSPLQHRQALNHTTSAFCNGLQTLAGCASSDLLFLPRKVDLFPNLAAAKSM